MHTRCRRPVPCPAISSPTCARICCTTTRCSPVLLELTRLHGRPSTRAALSAGLALGVLLVFAMDFMMRLLRGHFVDLASARIDVELSVLIMERVLGIQLEAKPASVTALIDFHLPSSFCWSSPGFPGRWYSFRSSA